MRNLSKIFFYGVMAVVCMIVIVPTTAKAQEETTQKTFQRRYTLMKGTLDKDDILEKNRAFRTKYDQYKIDAKAVEVAKSLDKDVTVLVFLGTWCPDSQRNVPPFFHLIEEADNAHIKTKFIGVDRRKQDPDFLVDDYEVSRVPTFIVLQGEKELGRVIERPKLNIESDIAAILKKAE